MARARGRDFYENDVNYYDNPESASVISEHNKDGRMIGAIVRTNPNGNYYAVWEDGTILAQYPTEGLYDFEGIMNATQSAQTRLDNYGASEGDYAGGVRGLGMSYQDVAKDLNYEDIARYIDSNTGQIIDRNGMINHLKTLPGFSEKSVQDINALLSTMPNMAVDQGDYRQARATNQADIYGLQSEVGEARQKQSAGAGASGVYSPTATGFGFGDESGMGSVYGQLADKQAQGGDVYGLANKKEEEFANWMAGVTAD